MSLVLEALRRVEKPGARTGSVGVGVSSYRPARRRHRLAVPLLLGLATGGAFVFLLGPQAGGTVGSNTPASVDSASVTRPRARPLKGRAGLPPPLSFEPGSPGFADSERTQPSLVPGGRAARRAGSSASRVAVTAPQQSPPLVLQAISERDSQPIAVINDRLVKEGERIGAIRIFKIGSDSVEVILENGARGIIRFAPPPPDPTPSPDRP